MTNESLGASRTALLHHLKRAGRSTILELASGLGLNIETVREHMKALVDQGLVRRDGSRRSGPGRPEIVFSLTAAAEAHFPRREGETLYGLATHLMETVNGGILQEYFEQRSDSRKAALMARVQHLEGEQRLEEVARFFSELGYMAEVDRSADPRGVELGGDVRLERDQFVFRHRSPRRDASRSISFGERPPGVATS